MTTNARQIRKWQNRNFRLMVQLGWLARNGVSRESEHAQRIVRNTERTFSLYNGKQV